MNPLILTFQLKNKCDICSAGDWLGFNWCWGVSTAFKLVLLWPLDWIEFNQNRVVIFCNIGKHGIIIQTNTLHIMSYHTPTLLLWNTVRVQAPRLHKNRGGSSCPVPEDSRSSVTLALAAWKPVYPLQPLMAPCPPAAVISSAAELEPLLTGVWGGDDAEDLGSDGGSWCPC